MTIDTRATTRGRYARLMLAAAFAVAVGATPIVASGQIGLIPNKGLNMMAVFTNCVAVPQQSTGYYTKPIMNQHEWPRPVVVFAPNRGRIDLMTNTQPDWAQMFSSNPALLQVPSRVQLTTGGTWNYVTESYYRLTDVASQPTPVKVTARSTLNPGSSVNFDVVVYPRFFIKDLRIDTVKASYSNLERINVVVQLPWALPSYANALKAVFSRPTFTWGGNEYEMVTDAWRGQPTVSVNQANGRNEIRLTMQIKTSTPNFSTPVQRIQWRRLRDITYTMDVELQPIRNGCQLVKSPSRQTLTFKVRNPDYSRR